MLSFYRPQNGGKEKSEDTAPGAQLVDELRAGHSLLKSRARLLNQSRLFLQVGNRFSCFHTFLFSREIRSGPDSTIYKGIFKKQTLQRWFLDVYFYKDDLFTMKPSWSIIMLLLFMLLLSVSVEGEKFTRHGSQMEIDFDLLDP